MTHRYETLEQAVDHALAIMRERFAEPDQSAVVALAQTLYAMQERASFEERSEGGDEVPYQV